MTERLIAPPALRHCMDESALAEAVSTPHGLSRHLAEAEQQAQAMLARQFSAGADIAELVQARAWVVERLVLTAW
ncbi:MAG: hypothetical protein AAGH65_07405, partial [Pseudomonadota bacterium]